MLDFGCVPCIFLTKFVERYRTSCGFTDKLVAVDGCRRTVNNSSKIFKVRPGNDGIVSTSILFRVRAKIDSTYLAVWLTCCC